MSTAAGSSKSRHKWTKEEEDIIVAEIARKEKGGMKRVSPQKLFLKYFCVDTDLSLEQVRNKIHSVRAHKQNAIQEERKRQQEEKRKGPVQPETTSAPLTGCETKKSKKTSYPHPPTGLLQVEEKNNDTPARKEHNNISPKPQRVSTSVGKEEEEEEEEVWKDANKKRKENPDSFVSKKHKKAKHGMSAGTKATFFLFFSLFFLINRVPSGSKHCAPFLFKE